MEERRRVLDREGWPLHPEVRCFRYTKTGTQLSEQVMVKGFDFSDSRYPQGIVHVEGLTSGGKGVTIPERLRMIRTPEGEEAPLAVQRYRNRQKDERLLEELDARKKEMKKVRRKVRRKQG